MTSRQRYSRAFRAAVEAYRASKVNRRLQDRSIEPEPLESSSSTRDPLQQEDEKIPTVREDDPGHEEFVEELQQEDEKVLAVEAAKRLTAALAGYSEQVRNAERPDPDTELEDAHRKMDMAMRIVKQGGISRALCRSLLPEVLRWDNEVKKTDSQKNLAFDATEINVYVEKVGYLGKVEKTNVEFAFDGRQFRVVHLDKGIRFGFDDEPFHPGKVNLHVDDHLVLAMDISRDTGTWAPSYWEGWRVNALDPGDWMQVLLRISAKIDSHKQRKRSTSDNDALEAASRINLPDDMENI